MKKYFNNLLIISFIISTVFAFGAVVSTVSATTIPNSGISISEFVELMISIGAVPADRVVAVRAMVSTLGNTISLPNKVGTSSAPYLQVLYPNGGESWDMEVSVPYTIKWGSSSKIPVTVSLVPAKGAVCDLTAAPIASRDSENSFNVTLKNAKCYNQKTGTSTSLVDGSYKARVSYLTGTSTIIKDESNAVFKVAPVLVPSLKVTYPVGGESLIRNREYVVKYKLTNASVDNMGLISYTLMDTDGNSRLSSQRLVNKTSTFDLQLPSSITPAAYKLQLTVTTSKGVELENTSGLFWISAAN